MAMFRFWDMRYLKLHSFNPAEADTDADHCCIWQWRNVIGRVNRLGGTFPRQGGRSCNPSGAKISHSHLSELIAIKTHFAVPNYEILAPLSCRRGYFILAVFVWPPIFGITQLNELKRLARTFWRRTHLRRPEARCQKHCLSAMAGCRSPGGLSRFCNKSPCFTTLEIASSGKLFWIPLEELMNNFL